jgi:hypothetical protein
MRLACELQVRTVISIEGQRYTTPAPGYIFIIVDSPFELIPSSGEPQSDARRREPVLRWKLISTRTIEYIDHAVIVSNKRVYSTG